MIEYRAGSTATFNAQSGTIAIPASVQVGDFLILGCSRPVNEAAPTISGDWTQAGPTTYSQASNGSSLSIFTKVAVAGDAGSNVTVTLPISGRVALGLIALSGASQLDLAPSFGSNSSSALTTAKKMPLVQAATAGAMGVHVIGLKANPAVTSVTPPADVTERVELLTGINSGPTMTIGTENVLAASAGSSLGDDTWTATSSQGVWATLAVQPTPPAPPSKPPVDILIDGSWVRCEILGFGEQLLHVELAPKGPASQVAISFDSGSLGPQVQQSAGAVVAAQYGRVGQGVRLTPPDSTHDAHMVVESALTQNKRWASFTAWFRTITPVPSGTYVPLFEIGNALTVAPKGQLTVFFDSTTNSLTADFEASEKTVICPTSQVTDGQWHKIQARVDFGSATYRAYLRVDNGPTIDHVSSMAKTPTTARILWIHGYPSGTSYAQYTADFDDILATTADTDPGWL